MGKTKGFDHMKLIGRYAGGHRKLITLGRFIAAVSAIVVLIPYYDLWKIISIAVNNEDTAQISRYENNSECRSYRGTEGRSGSRTGQSRISEQL